MLRRGLHLTVNSDDPAYFGANLTDNLLAVQGPESGLPRAPAAGGECLRRLLPWHPQAAGPPRRAALLLRRISAAVTHRSGTWCRSSPSPALPLRERELYLTADSAIASAGGYGLSDLIQLSISIPSPGGEGPGRGGNPSPQRATGIQLDKQKATRPDRLLSFLTYYIPRDRLRPPARQAPVAVLQGSSSGGSSSSASCSRNCRMCSPQ